MSEEHGFTGDALSAPAECTEEPIEFDQLFSLLSVAQRRHALYCVAETPDATLSADELVDDVVELERRVPNCDLSRHEIELSLRHTHLPKLAAADVIDYDAERSIVDYRGGRRVDRWIDRSMEEELPRSAD